MLAVGEGVAIVVDGWSGHEGRATGFTGSLNVDISVSFCDYIFFGKRLPERWLAQWVRLRDNVV